MRIIRGRHGATGGPRGLYRDQTTQIAHGDTPKEIGEIYGRYFDAIAIRHVTGPWGTIPERRGQASRVPVLNMQCEVYHPFQCLADLMTIIEKKGRDLRRKKLVVSWAYAGSYQKPISVPVAGAADATLWAGRCAGPPARVQADARYHRAGAGPGAEVTARALK